MLTATYSMATFAKFSQSFIYTTLSQPVASLLLFKFASVIKERMVFLCFYVQPVGVVGAITPWNFPLAMITRKVGLSWLLNYHYELQ